MAELRDLYDINSNKTDKTYRKGEPIPEGYYPMVVMVVIRNSKGEFLMQKRVESKGGDWGVTGGHPKSGETPLEGIVTEVKEELGLDFSNETFIEYDSGCDGKDCYKMYFVNKDVDIKEMKIQPIYIKICLTDKRNYKIYIIVKKKKKVDNKQH
mgnify:CR=1 FL=1